MAQHVRLWEIDRSGEPQDLPQARLDLESRLEEWLERDVSMLGSDLLIIGKQVPTDYGGIIDLLCIDAEGDLVIVELKRDKTPREITAQALDYASWVTDLDSERISEIAAEYLGARGPLESAFESHFRAELPEVINQSHKILIVASAIDPSSERIIRYLSQQHGVNINAATFQFFRTRDSSEFLARVFLAEPSQVEQRTRSSQRKRKPRLSIEELQAVADDNDVGEAFREVFEILRPRFDGVRTTRSTLNLVQYADGRRVAIINLVPAESDSSRGVRFQVYAHRFAEYAGLSESDIRSALPADCEPWSFGANMGPDWSGYAGYWTPEQATRFVEQTLRSRSGA